MQAADGALAAVLAGASAARCCVRCLVARGPHAGASVVVCRAEATLQTPLLVVGRKKSCSLRLLRDLEVSSAHAEVRLAPAPQEDEEKKAEVSGQSDAMRVVVRDAKSTNGSKLNGQPLTPLEDYALSDGDLISVGRSSVRVRFVAHFSGETTEAEQPSDAPTAVELVAPSASIKARLAGSDVPAEKAGDGGERSEARCSRDGVDPAVTEGLPQELATERRPEEAAERASDRTGKLKKKEALERAGDERKQPRRDDHADDDAFESPKGMHWRAVSGNSTASSRHVTCMVCSQWLGMLDVMEQQLHINACLDGRGPLVPDSTSADPVGRASRPPKPPKKRKRRGGSDPEQEQLTLAMALSKSLAGEGQQVEMQLALVRQELGHVDAQMAKLTKKRAALIKSMARLEKKATKLRKSRVRPPAEVRALLRIELALDAMFPREREAAIRPASTRPSTAKRRRWVYQLQQDGDDSTSPSLSLSCVSQPDPEPLVEGGSSEERVSMWARASQQPIYDQRERQVYYNSVLLAFLAVDTPSIEHKDGKSLDGVADMARQDGADRDTAEHSVEEWMPMPESSRVDAEEGIVPDVVKRAFPNWRQDLEFLQERSVDELQDALDELVRARQDGHLALLTQSQVPMDDTEQSLQDNEREEACLYMESVMRRLLGRKTQVYDELLPSLGGDNAAECQQQPIIDLADDEEEGETEEAAGSDTLYRGSDVPGSFESIMSISDSDEEPEVDDEVAATGQLSFSDTDGDSDPRSAISRGSSLFSTVSKSSSPSDDEGREDGDSGTGGLREPPIEATQAASGEPISEDAGTRSIVTQASTDPQHKREEGLAPPVNTLHRTATTDNGVASSGDDSVALAEEDHGVTEITTT